MQSSEASGAAPRDRSRPAHREDAIRSPNCFACRSFFITHELGNRYGCRFFGMKSSVLPSITVLQSSGKACQAFEPKPGS